MCSRRVKCLSVAVFSLLFLGFSAPVSAQHNPEGGDHPGPNVTETGSDVHPEAGTEAKFDPGKEMLDHIADAHEFHFFTIEHKGGEDFHATIPLPILLYSPQRGVSFFMSSKFEHGHATYDGYKLVEHDIIPVDAAGKQDKAITVYDFSLTKNVVQMLIALAILFILLVKIANKYKSGKGVTSAPSGFQNAIEPVILFVRDDIAKPNLSGNANKYMPYLLTVFFFILINNIFGLIPGSANVTGNIAFTAVLGIISLLVILFSTNKHFWGHIFWFPGVPVPVKIMMLPVELLGVFTKPFALIIRLFANMTAGHIIILSFVSLIFIFTEMAKTAGVAFAPVSIAFAVFIYVIEILVAFIQAYIFTNLTAVFIGQALGDPHLEEAEHH